MDNPTARMLLIFVIVLAIVSSVSVTALVMKDSGNGSATVSSVGLDKDELKEAILEIFRTDTEAVLMAFEEGRQEALSAQQQAGLEQIGIQRDALENDSTHQVLGNKDGDVAVVEFFDYNCGFCKRVAPDLQQLMEEDKNVKVVLIDFPILGQASLTTAKAAVAVNRIDPSKVSDFHFAALQKSPRTEEQVLAIAEEIGISRAELKEEMESSEVQDKLNKNLKLGRDVGVRGTPAFIIGGQMVPGAVNLSEFKARVKQARAAK